MYLNKIYQVQISGIENGSQITSSSTGREGSGLEWAEGMYEILRAARYVHLYFHGMGEFTAEWLKPMSYVANCRHDPGSIFISAGGNIIAFPKMKMLSLEISNGEGILSIASCSSKNPIVVILQLFYESVGNKNFNSYIRNIEAALEAHILYNNIDINSIN